jgi:cellulose synthase/poly-beta-1,6-N-acetylglucosamine synthase-like glycosyltransferase
MNVELISDNPIMNVGILISFVLFTFLSFQLITLFRYLIKKKSSLGYNNDYDVFKKDPYISVIIPVYNEEKNIIDCLTSLTNSNYDLSKIEVIVVDDGSIDRTVKLVNSFISSKSSLDISLIKGKHAGKSEALNLGIRESKYDLIVTIDSDIVLSKKTLKKLILPLADNNVVASNCVSLIEKPQNLLEHFQVIEYALNNLIRVSFSSVFDNSIWFFGAVAAYKKEILKSVGYFKKDSLTEDMDICLEIFDKNKKVVTIEDSIITTEPCHSLKELFSQRMRWYYGALQSLFKNKHLLEKERRVPSILFLFFNQIWWTFYSFVFFPLTIYQVFYWFPSLSEGFLNSFFYLFRWFSLSGPFYVLYKMPVWGFSLLNFFGVSSGIITFIMALFALKKFKAKINLLTLVALFFYFPYNIINNLIIVFSIFKYKFSKNKYFIE